MYMLGAKYGAGQSVDFPEQTMDQHFAQAIPARRLASLQTRLHITHHVAINGEAMYVHGTNQVNQMCLSRSQ